MICVKSLTKKYGTNTVLDDINVNFIPGCSYGLVGPNGCGKTTLMRCICGFTKPTSGTVTVNNIVVGRDRDFAPATGIVIELPGFLPYFSGRRNLEMYAAMSGNVTEERITETMRIVGLDDMDKKPVGKYSLGMRQRLGIAQAIMENPQILILDEPFNGLDKEGICKIYALLNSEKEKGVTIILSSHRAADIAQACDTVYEVEHGKLKQVFPLENIIS